MKTAKKLEKCIIGSLHTFSEEEVSIIQKKLLIWYHKNKRLLPWRTIAEIEKDINKRVYSVWISEIMLQQTQVATVISYFQKWISKWPTVETLSKATLEEVNEVWAGLGYYSRARRLHEGAVKVVEELNGEIPRTRDKLISGLPGVGQYTGSAIASIALKENVGVVDGNVVRVFSRLRGIGKDSTSQVTIDHFWSLANGIVDLTTPGDFNQGLMELGATICTPKNPQCTSCPLSNVCVAYAKCRNVNSLANHFIKSENTDTKQEDQSYLRDIECLPDCDFCFSKEDWNESLGVQNYPRKGQKTKSREEISAVVLIRRTNGEMLLLQRPAKGLLANLYEFVSISISGEDDYESYVTDKLVDDYGLTHKTAQSRKYITEVLHIFSHIRQTYRVYILEVNKDAKVIWPSHYQSHVWLNKDAFLASATSTAMKKVLKATDSSATKNKDKSSKRKLEITPLQMKKQKSIASFFVATKKE
ncbi:unnamed protein product, partial [Meganyctiphanes norvegica]